EEFRLEADLRLVSLRPLAAVDENHDRRVLRIARSVNVKPLFLRCVGDIRQVARDDAVGREARRHVGLGARGFCGGRWLWRAEKLSSDQGACQNDNGESDRGHGALSSPPDWPPGKAEARFRD